ncbi:MAG: hypothetical protein K0R28_1005 [Paenibacillus sp.]|nr:hypothetical protein [Paenibacillus sp.]
MMEISSRPAAFAASHSGIGERSDASDRNDECPFKQPSRCVACVWGRWEASRQFCMMPVCIKETVPDGNGRERG